MWLWNCVSTVIYPGAGSILNGARVDVSFRSRYATGGNATHEDFA